MNRKMTEKLLEEIDMRIRARARKSKYTASALNGGLRQANKSDLVAIGRALGLQCSEREQTMELARRVLEAAQLIKRNHDNLYKELKLMGYCDE